MGANSNFIGFLKFMRAFWIVVFVLLDFILLAFNALFTIGTSSSASNADRIVLVVLIFFETLFVMWPGSIISRFEKYPLYRDNDLETSDSEANLI